MKKILKSPIFADVNRQAADVLVRSTFDFLLRNDVSKESILAMALSYADKTRDPIKTSLYKKLVRAYDDMGVILSTWFSNPEFLDSDGRPLALSVTKKGSNSFRRLLRASRAQVKEQVALELMRQSPSIEIRSDGSLVALRRVFVLTNFSIPRAAFTVERYLDTVRKSASARKSGTVALLERSSHVSKIDLATVAPLLRSIESRGTAFMDSVDGEIEGRRLRRGKQNNVGEIGVLVFTWTKRGATSIRQKKVRRGV